MSNEVERVAQALAKSYPYFRPEPEVDFATMARAAIAAMRDSLKTEDYSFSEASAIRRFFDEALEPVDDEEKRA